MSTEESPFAHVALSISMALAKSDPGDLSAARKMDPNIGTPVLWRLAAKHEEIERCSEEWGHYCRLLSLMVPVSSDPQVYSIHNPAQSFGRLLVDGGVTNVKADSAPYVSEIRFSKFLAARGKSRLVLLENMVRQISSGASKHGLDVVNFAGIVHNHDAAKKQLIRNYYKASTN